MHQLSPTAGLGHDGRCCPGIFPWLRLKPVPGSILTEAPRETRQRHTNILKLVISKFLRLVFIHSYFTAAFYIINIIYLPALYLANIPQIYDNVMQRKGLLWMRLPSSEWRGRISPWISPVHQQNRFPTTILWYLQYSTFYST